MSLKNSPYWGQPKEAVKVWITNIVGLLFIGLFIGIFVPDFDYTSIFASLFLGFCFVLAVTFFLKQQSKSGE